MRILAVMAFVGAGLLATGPSWALTGENGSEATGKEPVAEAKPPPATDRGSAAGAGSTGDASAPAATAEAPPKPKIIAPVIVANVNLTTQRMTVAVNGKVQYAWPISSGLPGYPTPRGKFTATWMSRMHYSKQYDDAPMPHSVFFKDGAAIHGSYAVRQLGTPASHGCVRLAPANAATFYNLVSRYGLMTTRINVQGNPPSVRVASRARDSYDDDDDYSDRRRDRRGMSRRSGNSYAWSGSNRGPSWWGSDL
jgi:lipoprotein-anchoring transpeptidase ErfK/SrfK